MNRIIELLRKAQEEAPAYRWRLSRGEVRLLPEKEHPPVKQIGEKETSPQPQPQQ
jgi:hypothetical protein